MDYEANKSSQEMFVTKTKTYSSQQEALPSSNHQFGSYSYETSKNGAISGGLQGGEFGKYQALGGANVNYGQNYVQQASYNQAVPFIGQNYYQGGVVNATAPIVMANRRLSGGLVQAPIAYNFGEANKRTSFVLEASPLMYDVRPERRSVILENTQNVQVVQRPQHIIPVYRQIHYVQQPQTTVQTVQIDNSAELEQLRITIRTQSEEIQSWRLKYETLYAQFQAYQDQNKSSSYELESLRISYESRLSECISEIERLNGVLRVKLEEIERLRSTQTQSYEYESQIVTYRNEIDSLRMELENAYSAKRQKSEEAEEYRRKYMSVETTISDLKYEISRLQGDLSMRDREISDWRSRYSSLEIEIQTVRESSIMNQDYEMKIALLTQEIERLNVMIKNKNKDIEGLQYDISTFRSEISQKERMISELRTEMTTLEYSYSEKSTMEKKLMDYENRIALLSQEIERLNSMNSTKTYEIENLKRSSMRIDEQEMEVQRLRSSLEEWKTKYNSISYEISSRESRVRELESTISSLRIEIERLQSMSMNTSEVEIWKGKYSSLMATFVLLCAEVETLRMGSFNTESNSQSGAVYNQTVIRKSGDYGSNLASERIVRLSDDKLESSSFKRTSYRAGETIGGGYSSTDGGYTSNMAITRTSVGGGAMALGDAAGSSFKRSSYNATDGGVSRSSNMVFTQGGMNTGSLIGNDLGTTITSTRIGGGGESYRGGESYLAVGGDSYGAGGGYRGSNVVERVVHKTTTVNKRMSQI